MSSIQRPEKLELWTIHDKNDKVTIQWDNGLAHKWMTSLLIVNIGLLNVALMVSTSVTMSP